MKFEIKNELLISITVFAVSAYSLYWLLKTEKKTCVYKIEDDDEDVVDLDKVDETKKEE